MDYTDPSSYLSCWWDTPSSHQTGVLDCSKQRYRRTHVSSLQDIADVVTKSADVNEAQLVSTQEGKTIVPVYNWADFLKTEFKKIPKIKMYHHFQFSSSTPGSVSVQEFSDSDSTLYPILADNTWVPAVSELPCVVPPSGLSDKRQWYLYKDIRVL